MSTEMTGQLIEAAVLLAVGMSVVFAFLVLLIGGIHAIAWFCRKYPSEEATPNTPKKRAASNQAAKNKLPASVSPQVAAAITAAVHTHRHTTLKS